MKLNYFVSIVLALFSFPVINAEDRSELLREESKAIFEKSLRIALKFYSLEQGKKLKKLPELF